MAAAYPDPISQLMEDHRRFLRTVQEFQDELAQLSPGAPAPEAAPRRVAEFARFLKHDVDRIHGQQEERGLFPVLGRHITLDGGPVGVMISEHEELRRWQGTLDRDARRLAGDREAEEVVWRIRGATAGVDGLLAMHVEKEDTMLFPIARELLSPRELEEVRQVFLEVATHEPEVVLP